MTRFFIIVLLMNFVLLSNAQKWTLVDSQPPINETIDFKPSLSKLFEINDTEIKKLLWLAPHENKSELNESNHIIALPTADGRIHNFKIIQYNMMEEGLARQFPDFRTYYGVDLFDPFTNVRIDYTSRGIRAVIKQELVSTYIEYYTRENNNLRLVYYRHDYPNLHDWQCHFDKKKSNDHRAENNVGNRVGDCIFRSYRLANAATGEYTAFHGGTVPLGQAAIVTAINRVNQIYEFDIAVRLILVANNANIVYTNGATDPYTNDDGFLMLDENTATCNSIIMSGNYDIGHVFSTGGGGVAGLGVVCSTSKAEGVTGLSSPTGDPFYIDYVCHEMGHQFGGNHTFNSASNSNGNCDPGNNNPSTSVEPGSGTTIMAYAGICSPVNVQNFSDPYFHTVSLAEMKAHVQGSANCFVTIPFTNTPPIVSNISNYTIPISTPFLLTGIATDTEGDPLTFCWEQVDAATATSTPSSTSTTQTLFRSRIPTADPSRYFPQLSNILANTTNTWEVLPTVSRNINFRVTVRDRRNGIAGCTSNDDVQVVSSAGAGPFVVNVLNSAPPALLEGQTLNVAWSVANTNVAPVNATNVDILLSKDGGLTYPTVLANATPNDGSHDVVIPAGTAPNCRIMVKGSNNIFFDINNANFAINTGGVTYTLTVSPSMQTVCNSVGSIVYNISSTALGGYATPINLTVANVPSGVSAVFSSTSISPGQTATLTLANYSTLSGTFNITVTGTSGSIVRNENANFMLLSIPAVPSLTSPANSALVSPTPTLTWSTGTNFDYQISTDINFTTIVNSGTTTSNLVTITTPLQPSTIYYWRVRDQNTCGQSAWSSVRDFQTMAITCITYVASVGLPLAIPSTVATVNAFLNIKDKGILEDVNITNLVGTHSWISDLKFTLKTPNNSGSVILLDQPCDDENNFNIKFDDAAANAAFPCPPIDGLTYKPVDPLSNLNTKSLKGNWNLQIQDLVSDDGGSLTAWSVNVCASNFCRLEVQNNNINGVGSLFEAISCASSNDTINFASSVNNTVLNLGNQSLIINKNLTLLANAANNISMTSTSTTSPVIQISAGNNVKIIGLKILGSTNADAGIINQGILTLTDVEVIKNAGSTPATLLKNIGSGTSNFQGNCKIKN
jgi:hypothetical protein